MKEVFEMKVKLKVLTPLHIGNGEKWLSFQFFLYNGKIYFFDFDALRNAFSKVLQREKMESLLTYHWSENKDKGRNKDGDSILAKFLKNHGKSPAHIIQYAKYSLVCPSIKVGGEVESFIKFGEKNVFIPGSSVKGAIRTAVLYCTFKRILGKNQHVQRAFQSWLQVFNISGKFDRAIQQKENEFFSLFATGYYNFGSRVIQMYMGHLMYLLSVSDSEPKPVENVCHVAGIQTGSSKHPAVFREVVEKGKEFSIEINYLDEREELILKETLKNFGEWVKKEIESQNRKGRHYYNPKQIEGSFKNFSHEFLCSLKRWSNCLKEWFQDFVNVQMQVLGQMRSNFPGNQQIYQQAWKFYLSFPQRFQSSNKVPLRLGKGQGFLSLTLWILALSSQNSQLHRLAQQVIGRILKSKYGGRSYGFPTKTLQNIGGEPVNWCEIEIR